MTERITDEELRQMGPGQIIAIGLDPRMAIIANMAAPIYVALSIEENEPEARRLSVDAAFLLFGDIAARLEENRR